MKKLFFIILLFISLLSTAQVDEYYRIVDWKFYPDSITQLTDSTYSLLAIPIDYNDPGAIKRWVGNYVVDYIGHRFKVIDSTSTKITILDIYKTGQAPQSLQIARCYRSVGDGEAEYIGSVDYSPLDESARWKLNGSDNELLWIEISKKLVQQFYEISVSSDGLSSFTIPFTISSVSSIFINNAKIPSSLWSGVNSTTLTINVPLKLYDFITITKN